MPGKKAIPGIPFGSTVGDSLELVRKMWGMTGLPTIPSPANLAQMAVRLPQNLPNMVAPTLDLAELDKRIADLRAVEQWLQLNVGMLRTTIQSLEVQRGTIAALKGIGGAVLSPVLKAKAEEDPQAAALAQQLAAWQAWQAAMQAPTAASTAAAEPATEPEAAPAEPAKRRRRSRTARVVPAPLNPGVWWNAMQDQFARIAATAAAAAAEAAAEEDARARAAQPPAPAQPEPEPAPRRPRKAAARPAASAKPVKTAGKARRSRST